MSVWLLDTTALVAHYRQELGAELTQSILDAFIAATAGLAGATLVHRDAHFNGISAGLVIMEELS
jgi:predicted nucleic acid-binding protein